MQSMGVWSLNHDITTSLRLPKIHPDLQRLNSVRVCFCYGCGMQSTGIWSLNHDIATSLGLRSTPIFQKSTPDLHRRNRVRVHPHAHPQHIKVLKHFVYI